MKLFVGGRQSGKTTQAIKLAAEKNLYIICPNVSEVHHIAQLARDMEKVIPFPLTWQEFVDKRYYGKNINGFVIDNLDTCIQQMSVVPIELATLTGSNPKEIKKETE